MSKTSKKWLLVKFPEILSKWNAEENSRQMPWKGEKNPYKIWLSEIILQQTRVEQGIKYYEHFIKAFPDVHKLASATDQKVYKLWEGLGYYARCRNLIQTARHISQDLKGRFPAHYEELRKLKGVGPYTAAAIASFAFDESRAVVDGNVFRVLSRVFGIDAPIDSTSGKKLFTQLASQLLDQRTPGLHNQAIMDFGAVVCKPVPLCQKCPFHKYCQAYLKHTISLLPVKTKKISVRTRVFNYVLVEHGRKFAVRQRTDKDIWHHLFEFLMFETNKQVRKQDILKKLRRLGWINRNNFQLKSFSLVYRQQLSHQVIKARFLRLQVSQKPGKSGELMWVTQRQLKAFPFPKLIRQYLLETGVIK